MNKIFVGTTHVVAPITYTQGVLHGDHSEFFGDEGRVLLRACYGVVHGALSALAGHFRPVLQVAHGTRQV